MSLSQTSPLPQPEAQDFAAFLDLFERTSRIGATALGGLHRLTASSDDGEVRTLFCDWLRAEGFEVRVDAIGNIFGLMTFDPDAAYVMCGSHLDSQPTAGRFDGIYGVLAGALAIRRLARASAETGDKPLHNLCVVNWTNEEGARFQPSLTGSSVFIGAMPLQAALDLEDGDGITLGDALTDIGFAGTTPFDLPVASYAEIHVEQGRALEAKKLAIGVVRETWAVSKWRVSFIGEQNHTGPTPMAERKDALLAAAHAIVHVREESGRHGLAMHSSVGRMEIYPNSPNVVPSRTTLLIELRSRDVSLLDQGDRRLEARLKEIAAETGTRVIVEDQQLRQPGKLHETLSDLALQTCEQLGLAAETSVTVAGHDAINLSRVCPTSLVFIPSENGLSHNEAEFTSVQDMENGLRFLTGFLARLSQTSMPESPFISPYSHSGQS